MQGNHIWMIYLDSGSMIKLEIDTDKLYLLKLLFKCHTVKPKFKSSRFLTHKRCTCCLRYI